MLRQIAIYARQSVDKKDSLSIETQIDKCKIYLHTTNTVVYEDKGYSGKNTDRPSLIKLINDITEGKIEKVIVYKLDRISRNITDFYKLYEIMSENKCEFISASECFDTSNAMGKAMMGILAVFAQMERENIQKRVKDNYYFRTGNTGSWPGGPAPYGYKLSRTKDNKPTLEEIPEEREAVERIFAEYSGALHITLGEIAKSLNQLGYKPHKREVFNCTTVSKILQNPIYVNADKLLYSYFKTRKIQFLNQPEEWDGSRSAHVIGKKVGNSNIRSYTDMKEQTVYLTNFKGFIPSFQYISVQRQLGENKQIARNNTMGVLEELGGKLKCKNCGYAVKAYNTTSGGMPILSCYGNASLHLCDKKLKKVNFFDLQEKIGEQIEEKLSNLHSLYVEKKYEAQKMIEDVEKQRDVVDNLVLMASKSETLTKATERIIEKEQTRLDELELKMQMTGNTVGYLQVSLETNIALNNTLSNGLSYDELSTDQKREIINILIEKILLTEDIDDFEIIWRI